LNALDLISAVTQIIYVLIFISVALRAARQPTTAHTDMALFFGAVAFIILVSRLAALVGTTPPAWLTALEIAILMALPYILLRLVDDFTHVRTWVKRASELGLAAGIVAIYAAGPTVTPVLLYVVVYFFVLSVFCAIEYIRAARRSRAVTRRLMEAI
jgi:hypothetical protein